MLEINQILVLFTLVAFVVMGIVLFMVIRLVSRMKRTGEDKDPSQVGFVVETFHELVAELKEKEGELEALNRKAEERADTIEDYNESILQSVPSGVVSMDASWKVVKVNASACNILGTDEKALHGRDGHEVFADIIADHDRRSAIQVMHGRGELRHTAPSGRKLWLGYSLSPLRDALGQDIGRLLVFTDLTELKALEEQAALRKRLSSLGEMAAGIAHELRNPMGVISGYTRMLGKKVGPDAIPTVDAISEEVEVMEKIISDFLSFARPRSLELAEINLRALVSGCLEKAASASPRNVRLGVSVDSGISLKGDELLLRQVLVNLIQNAMEATPDGGEVSVSARVDGKRVELRVTDTGHGIDRSIADSVFNPFFTTKDKGTGLGLALVHRIVTSHSGTITIESPEQGGTAFVLRLPRELSAGGDEDGQLGLQLP